MPTLKFIHFNDVYHITARQKEPCGGAARFVHALKQIEGDTVTIFSGDAFNPSLESSATKGAHMVPVLNACEIDVATYGNHDLDFGEEVLNGLSDQTEFPWVLSNMHHADGACLARGLNQVILERAGIKIGFFGLGELEWVDTLPDPPEDLIYTDFIDKGNEMVEVLRSEGCDLVCAVTHMRLPNDLKLAEAVHGLDFIFGGHDHFYQLEQRGECHLIKSGTDFREYTVVEVDFDLSSRTKGNVRKTRHEITLDTPEDAAVAQFVSEQDALLSKRLDQEVGYTEVPWDVRVAEVRTKESAVGSMAAGVIRCRYGADIGFICGGTLRSDRVYPPGPITARDVNQVFAFQDPCVVIKIKGSTVLQALENGVSKYPAHDGRFPQVSGLRFSFDPRRDPGNRVVKVTVGEDRDPLQLDVSYTLATRQYIASGHDGYECFKGATYVVDEELGSMFPTVIISALREVKVLKSWKQRYRIFRTAIAAWRGSRSRSSSKGTEEQGIIVRPQLDGRIEVLAAAMDKDSDATRRPTSLSDTVTLLKRKTRRSADYGSDLEDGLSPVTKMAKAQNSWCKP